MPVTRQEQVVLVLFDVEDFTGIKEARGTLPALDVGLRNQGIHAFCRFYEQRIAPMGIDVLLLHSAAKTAQCLHLGCGRHGEETLGTVAPLHHPALRALWDDVCGMLFGYLAVLQILVFIAEGDAVIV